MPDEPDGSPRLDPKEAFQLFSHGLRLEILLALWESPDYSMTFSDLRRAVGERDSGKLTSHLGKLRGQFVERVGDRYVFQYAGHRVIDAVRSGVFHESPSVAPAEALGACPRCGPRRRSSTRSHSRRSAVRPARGRSWSTRSTPAGSGTAPWRMP